MKMQKLSQIQTLISGIKILGSNCAHIVLVKRQENEEPREFYVLVDCRIKQMKKMATLYMEFSRLSLKTDVFIFTTNLNLHVSMDQCIFSLMTIHHKHMYYLRCFRKISNKK